MAPTRMAFPLLSPGPPPWSPGSKGLTARPLVVQLVFRMTIFRLEGTSEACPLPSRAQTSPEHDDRDCFPSALNSSHPREFATPLPLWAGFHGCPQSCLPGAYWSLSPSPLGGLESPIPLLLAQVPPGIWLLCVKSEVVLDAMVLDLSSEYWGKMHPGSPGTRSKEPDGSLKIWLRGVACFESLAYPLRSK